MMVRAIAIKQQVFEEFYPLFIYFERYWMRLIGPEGFSVYGINHYTNNFWGVGNITRLEMIQILNGQQVRRRFTSSRNINSVNISNALEDIQNGSGSTMVFLKRIAFINETFVNITYNGQMLDDPQEDVEEVTAPVPKCSPIQIINNDLSEIVEVCIICFDEETNVTLRPCETITYFTIRLMEDNFNTDTLCRASIVAYDGIQL